MNYYTGRVGIGEPVVPLDRDLSVNEKAQPLQWHLLPSADAIAATTAERILTSAAQAIAERGHFRIVLAGGRTPQATYQKLAQSEADWAHWLIYYGDERCLPVNDPQRNSTMAATAWLDHVPVPPHQVFPIEAEQGAAIAAQRYRDVVMSAIPFDVVLLGMGEDGHTASLFPGQRPADDAWVVAIADAPKPPPDRVSLTAKALTRTRECIVLITGQGKAAAVRQWRDGKALPIARATACGADIFLDRAASGQ